MTMRFQLCIFIVCVAEIMTVTNGQVEVCPTPNPHCDCTNLISDGDISCSNVQEIPAQLPSGTTLLELNRNFIGPILDNNQVSRLASLNLVTLVLANNLIELIEDRAFEDLDQLTSLDLGENHVTVITDNTFVGLKSLQQLYMNDMALRELPAGAFIEIPTLVYLDLENNRLESIGREFTSLTQLTTLLLANNQITSIAREALSGLVALNHLSLFGNKLTIPQSSWFRDIVENDGNVELNSRISSPNLRSPNPWQCCPDSIVYYYYLQGLDATLQSYYQLDLTCTWPITISGLPISALTLEQINAVPCANFSRTTTTPAATISTSSTTTVPIIQLAPSNFLSGLNDAGAFFILLFIAVLSGLMVCLGIYFYQKRKNNTKEMGIANFDAQSSNTNITTRPYTQNAPAYGATDQNVGEPSASTNRPINVAQRNFASTYNVATDTDQSEDEVWNIKQRNNI